MKKNNMKKNMSWEGKKKECEEYGEKKQPPPKTNMKRKSCDNGMSSKTKE